MKNFHVNMKTKTGFEMLTTTMLTTRMPDWSRMTTGDWSTVAA
jgi:hypothetical protein